MKTVFALGVLCSLAVAAQPVIKSSGIVNAAGYQTVLAPDTVFVIFGSGLGPPTLQTAAPPSYPIVLGGTSISFAPSTIGVAIPAKLVYTSAGQVAGLLPSFIAPGTYSVTLTYNGQPSAPQSVTVVARSFGIATQNSSGAGTAQATIGNVNNGLSLTRFSGGNVASGGYNYVLGPAHPGDTVVLWGTGGGADAANDTGGTSGDQTAKGNFIVYANGVAITPLYAGASSGYPGLFQVNFTLPTTFTPDCFVYLQVSAGGQLSNGVTLPVAPAGQNVCSTPGFTPASLAKLDAGSDITFAGLTIGKTNIGGAGFPSAAGDQVIENVGGPFNRYTAADWAIEYEGPQYNGCIVFSTTYASDAREPGTPYALLDAGARLSFSGPNVNAGATVSSIAGVNGPIYTSNLIAGTLAAGGTYTLSGTGGSQVGPFTASATMPTSFTLTNSAALTSVDRSQPYTVNWTGTGFDLIHIIVSGTTPLTGATHQVTVSCSAPASAGTFSVPAAALQALPQVTKAVGVGQVSITASPNVGGTASAVSATCQTLTPPLVAGGQVDFGCFTSYLRVVKNVTIQ